MLTRKNDIVITFFMLREFFLHDISRF